MHLVDCESDAQGARGAAGGVEKVRPQTVERLVRAMFKAAGEAIC